MKHLFSILAVALLVTGCSSQLTGNVVDASQEPVQIGAIFMLTGVGANVGAHSRMGADLAVAQINAAGGINGRQLEIVYEDNKDDSAVETIQAHQRLTASGITTILGPNWAGAGAAIAPVACDAKTLTISPSMGSTAFTNECLYTFNLHQADDLVSEILARNLYHEQGSRTLAIIGSQQTWEYAQAKAIKDTFEAQGGKVVAYELPQIDQKSFKTEVLKVLAAKPDAVYVQYTYEDLVSRELRDAGVTAPLYTVLIDGTRIVNANGALEGSTTITSFTPTSTFVQTFTDTYGKAPDLGSDAAYDAVMLIAEAMTATSSTDATVLAEYLSTKRTYSGASGALVFDSNGGVTKETRMQVVQNGSLVNAN